MKSPAPKPQARHIDMSDEEINHHHEARFTQVDRDVGALKTDVGILQADVRTLRTGQTAMQESQDRGFQNIQAILQAKSQEQPKISVGMLASVVGMMFTAGGVGIAAFWAVVLLLTDPLKADLSAQKLTVSAVTTNLALISERSERLREDVAQLNNLAEREAESRGRQDALHEALREQLSKLEARERTATENLQFMRGAKDQQDKLAPVINP